MTKLHIFKNMWQCSNHKKTAVDGSENAVQGEQREDELDTPPPQYTEFASKIDSRGYLPEDDTPYPLSTEAAQQSSNFRRTRLLWFFMEILAVSFSADYQRLKDAQLRSESSWAIPARTEDSYSVLNGQSRAMLTELSNLVSKLHKEMRHDRWLLVSGRDLDLIRKIVLEPVRISKLNLDYVLEVLGRYKRVEGCSRLESTLLGYWMQSSTRTAIGDTIASHALLLGPLRLRPELHIVLEDSINKYQKEEGLEKLHTSRELREEAMASLAETCCWPLCGTYMDLARGLRGLQASGEMHDRFGPSRTRLRESRKLLEHRERISDSESANVENGV